MHKLLPTGRLAISPLHQQILEWEILISAVVRKC